MLERLRRESAQRKGGVAPTPRRWAADPFPLLHAGRLFLGTGRLGSWVSPELALPILVRVSILDTYFHSCPDLAALFYPPLSRNHDSPGPTKQESGFFFFAVCDVRAKGTGVPRGRGNVLRRGTLVSPTPRFGRGRFRQGTPGLWGRLCRNCEGDRCVWACPPAPRARGAEILGIPVIALRHFDPKGNCTGEGCCPTTGRGSR